MSEVVGGGREEKVDEVVDAGGVGEEGEEEGEWLDVICL